MKKRKTAGKVHRITNPKGNIATLSPPWKAGQSGNPNGRKTIGATIKEWMNSFADLTEIELRQIARDKSLACNKRMAAIQMLDGVTVPDMADFEGVNGSADTPKKSLTALRSEGIDTTQIKRLSPNEYGTAIELHDRYGDALDRIMDRTDGKPKQTTEITGEGGMPLAVTITTPQTKLAK